MPTNGTVVRVYDSKPDNARQNSQKHRLTCRGRTQCTDNCRFSAVRLISAMPPASCPASASAHSVSQGTQAHGANVAAPCSCGSNRVRPMNYGARRRTDEKWQPKPPADQPLASLLPPSGSPCEVPDRAVPCAHQQRPNNPGLSDQTLHPRPPSHPGTGLPPRQLTGAG